MDSLEVVREFLSCGCSCRPGCVDWAPSDRLAMAVGQKVVILDTNLLNAIACHVVATEAVSCVKWVSGDQNCNLFVTASVNGSMAVWRWSGTDLEQVCFCEAHKSSIGYVCGYLLKRKTSPFVLVSCGSDSLLSFWSADLESSKIQSLSVIDLNGGLALCANVSELDGNCVAAVGMDDNSIRLYLQSSETMQFEHTVSLRGHTDWVRDLAFGREEDGHLMLASCSQDSYVRLWTIDRVTEKPSTDDQIEIKPQILHTDSTVAYSVSVPVPNERTT